MEKHNLKEPLITVSKVTKTKLDSYGWYEIIKYKVRMDLKCLICGVISWRSKTFQCVVNKYNAHCRKEIKDSLYHDCQKFVDQTYYCSSCSKKINKAISSHPNEEIDIKL